MFCLATDLMITRNTRARELAAAYKWRWDGSETALREAQGAAARRWPGHRADAPLRLPGPGPRNTRCGSPPASITLLGPAAVSSPEAHITGHRGRIGHIRHAAGGPP